MNSSWDLNVLSLSTVGYVNESSVRGHEGNDVDVVGFSEILWSISAIDWIVGTLCSPWLSSVEDVKLFIRTVDSDFSLTILVSVDEVESDPSETRMIQGSPILASFLVWIVLSDVMRLSEVVPGQDLNEVRLELKKLLPTSDENVWGKMENDVSIRSGSRVGSLYLCWTNSRHSPESWLLPQF